MPGSLKRGLATTKPKFPTMAANPKKRTKLSVPPPPATSSSDEDSLPSDDDENDEEEDEDDDDDDDDKAAMLRALEAHGQAMFGGVDLPVALGPAASANAKGKRRAAVRTADDEHSDDSGDEEASWEGEDDEDDDEENEDEGMDDDDDDEEEEEDAPDATSSGSRAPEVVVYAPSSTKFEQSSDKSAYKAFMSSKSSKILANPSALPGTTRAEENEEKVNTNLDKTLHSLLLTSLLSPGGDHSSSPVALQGRLNELAGVATLGSGEQALKRAEVSRLNGSKGGHVGRGLRTVGKQRWEKTVAEARERGDNGLVNSHTSTSIYATPDHAKSDGPRKEKDRGLTMGVGRFHQGVLKLSQADMDGVKREVERKNRGRDRLGGGRGGRGGRGRGGGGGGGGRGRGGGGGGRGRGGGRGGRGK